MIISKITAGFVIQNYDTETGKFMSQEFVAGDEVDYEDENGPIDGDDDQYNGIMDAYLPFDMVQPMEE